ncbi:SNF2-related protein [Nostoc sp. PCC 9305]|uniref:SNF2-related protein n=1 Tax=Nostoc sp. PCC 9305 TaxID=296636 RepID=UPI0039C6DB30
MSEHADSWPPHERFPYNYTDSKRKIDSKVKVVIEEDLNQSKNPLIITGYASLEKIIDFLSDNYQRLQRNSEAFNIIRILLGNEPYPTEKQEFSSSNNKFSEEIVQFWRERGISILKCAKVIAAIELLKNSKVHARIANKKPIHAKIYKGDNSITIGSSNFSSSGLTYQIEGNVRFKKQKETERFDEACLLAERIWELGKDYNDELIQLLEQLLRQVYWEEALARACAELLEGEWAKKYKTTSYLGDELQLWPSQEKGIAQAIWVIENVGSVLIADATGSGKTHMGSHLIKCLMNQIWKTGRMRHDIPVLICPPGVKNAWEKEFTDCGHSVKTVSHGMLSHSTPNEDIDIRAINRAQVLAVDEAHNFLNRGSNRTKKIFRNIADYVLLFTATPINKGSQDLLGIIELLGADNFDDQLLEQLKPIWNNRGKLKERMSPQVRERLRGAIQQFTVRRTKTILNRMIDEEPECYKDRFGKQCRYPKHQPKSYICGETDSDRAKAQQIREVTQTLLGLMYLKEIPQLPEYLRNQGTTEEKFIEWQLKRAKVLAAYQVMAGLRSSRAALLEHINGTDCAQEYFQLSGKIKAEKTGNSIKKLQEVAGKTPKNNLQIELPDWLSDSSKHEQACHEEIVIYENIANLCKDISDSRQETKTSQLIELLDKHKLVIAFDSRLISLHDIKRHLDQHKHGEVIIATGADKKEREHINQMFQLGSEKSGIIALCSDAMSEGVNLQQASAVVQLTMPSVMRLAEQRIGRIDRMDSPHSTIEALWPKDSNEFALRSSESKFFARHNLVSDLFGSNLPLPEDFSPEKDTDSSDDVVTSEDDLVKLEEKTWELGDVFDPVRSLVEGEGSLIENKRSLVSREVYNQNRTSKARGNSCLSFVDAHPEEPSWAFFAIAGTEWGAPRWVYLDELDPPITDLEEISKKLRKNLFIVSEYPNRETATIYLEKFLKKLIKTEKMLLPKKKQRALDEMKLVLTKYKDKAVKEKDDARDRLCNFMLSLHEEVELEQQRIDLSLLAEWWIDLIRPQWFSRLKEHRRFEPLRLQDIRDDLIQNPIPTEKLNEVFKVPKVKPLDKRIVAAIIGI